MRASVSAVKQEKAIEAELVRRVEAIGGLCEKVSSTKRGFPDRICFMPNGVIVLVELKRPRGGRLSPHQRQYHKKLSALGVVVEVLKTTKDIDRLMQRLSNRV